MPIKNPKAFKWIIIFLAVQPTNFVPNSILVSNLMTTCVQCNKKLFQRNRLLLPAVRLKHLNQPLGPLNLTGDRFRSPWRWLYKSLKEQPICRRSPQREQIPVRSASQNQGGVQTSHTLVQTHTSTHTLKMCRCMISSSLYFFPSKKKSLNHLDWSDFDDVCSVCTFTRMI